MTSLPERCDKEPHRLEICMPSASTVQFATHSPHNA